MTGAVGWSRALERWRAARPVPPVDLAALPDPKGLIEQFHPDHRRDGRSALELGPNAGDPCPAALADLLQARPLVDDIDLSGAQELPPDVLVIGGGGAGCAAALTAAAGGARVRLATKLGLGDGNTVMAEGGIQAAIGPDDSLQDHYDDTFAAGHRRAERELVRALVADGPESIRWLIGQGMALDSAIDPDTGRTHLVRARAGGTSQPRVHSFRDLTGLELMRVLREAVRLEPGITVHEHHPAIELLTDDAGHGAGAVLRDLRRARVVRAPASAVVVATGGSGQLRLGGLPTSNHHGATGDGLVLAYRAGARLADIDSFQYHPTGLAWPGRLVGQLVSEAVRSAGAHLVNGLGERFTDELGPRDLVAAAILRECAAGRGVERDGGVGVLLDVPTLVSEQPALLDRLLALGHLAERAGVDVREQPLLVHPTLHYQNGGVAIDEHGATGVPGLFAAGEVTGGIHGTNRLMGNALLEIIAFGRRSGGAAAEHARHHHPIRGAGLGHLRRWTRELAGVGRDESRRAPVLFPGGGT